MITTWERLALIIQGKTQPRNWVEAAFAVFAPINNTKEEADKK